MKTHPACSAPTPTLTVLLAVLVLPAAGCAADDERTAPSADEGTAAPSTEGRPSSRAVQAPPVDQLSPAQVEGLPAGFPDDFPIMNGMTVTGGFGGGSQGTDAFTVVFQTTASPEDVRGFYARAMPAAGWHEGPFSNPTLLSYERTGRGLQGATIMVTPLGAVTEARVNLLLEGGVSRVPSSSSGGREPQAREVASEAALPEGFPLPVRPDMEVRSVGAALTGTEYAVDFFVDDTLEGIRDWYEAQLPPEGWEGERVAYVRIEVENARYQGFIHFALAGSTNRTSVQARVRAK